MEQQDKVIVRSIGILTSGGDAPGMNAVIRGVVRAGSAKGLKVYGVKNGYTGLMNGEFELMGKRDVSNILHRGGTVLGSARSSEMKTPKGQREAIRQMNNIGIDCLIVCGGDGTMTGGNALSELGFPVIGIPAIMSANVLYVLIEFLIFLSLFSLPQAKVRGAEKSREDAIIMNMPIFIEQVYMCTEAGSNLYEALILVSDKSDNELGEVFLKAFRNAEVSGSWTKELLEAAKTLNMDAFSDFVNNIAVAHQKGIDISDTLRQEVDHINAIRKAKIKANTSELEARLVLPMAAFCFIPMMCLAVLPPLIAALKMF